MPEPEQTTNVTLGELMGGPAPRESPSPATAAGSPRRGIEPEPAPSGATQPGGSDQGALLEDEDYLLEPQRRLSRLTIVLVVVLIFLCGFIVGVLAARLTGGPPRGSAQSSLVLTIGSASASAMF